MNKPQTVEIAIKVTWFTIGFSILASLFNRLSGQMDDGTFIFALIFYGLFCIIPFKLNKGSNSARYFFAVITALSYVFLLGNGFEGIGKLDAIFCLVLIPFDIFIFVKLFHQDSAVWFSKAG